MFATHLAEDGSLTKKGHVQLNSSVTSTSETLAATPKAVKTAMDRADAAFLQANDIKGKWAGVVGSPLLTTDTQAQLQTKTQTVKNTLATNLTAKGQPTVGTESLTALANKVASVNTGKKWASGSGLSVSGGELSIRTLAFRPNFIIANGTSNNSFAIYKNGYCMTGATGQNPVVSSGTMYADGFDISTVFGAGTYDWIAFE